MQKLNVAQTLALLANLGVIAGIIFLAFEIRQNQVSVRAQTRNEIAQTAIQLSQFTSGDRIPEIVVRSDRGEVLSEEDEMRLNNWLGNWFNFWENLHYQHQLGLFDDDEFQGDLASMRYFLNERESLRARFCVLRDRGTLSPSFAVELEGLLEKPCD